MSNMEKTMEYQGVGTRLAPEPSRVLPFVTPQKTERPASTVTYPHYIFSPVHYEKGYAYPLIVWLHGSGADETQLLRVMPKINLRNYVAVAPRGLTWNESNDFRPIRDIKSSKGVKTIGSTYDWPESSGAIDKAEQRIFESIERAKERYNVNPQRVFLVGFDVGGTMAFRMAMQYPNYFGGVVSLGGQFPEKNSVLLRWNKIREFPVFLSVGAQSATFTPEKLGQQLRLFHTAGMSVTIRQYNTGQELTSKMLEDVNRWIMERLG